MGFLSECKEVYALLKVLEILCVSALSIYVNVLLLLMEVSLCIAKKAVAAHTGKDGKDYIFSPFRSFFYSLFCSPAVLVISYMAHQFLLPVLQDQ